MEQKAQVKRYVTPIEVEMSRTDNGLFLIFKVNIVKTTQSLQLLFLYNFTED